MSDIQTNPYNQPGSEPMFSAEEPPRQSRGCFFYGCLTAIVLAVLGLILMAVLSYVAYNWAQRMSQEYTSTTPMKLPPVTLSEDEQNDLEERWSAFKTAVDKGKAAELTLNADEINALVNRDPNIKGKVYVTIKGDKVTGQLSLPMDFLPLGLGTGRFLNGTATLAVSLRNGDLIVHAKEIEVNGKTPPDDVKAQIARENLARQWANEPKNAEMIERFDTIEIKDGLIHLKARSKDDKARNDDTPRTKDDADTPKDKDRDKAKGDEGEGDLPKDKAKADDDTPRADRPEDTPKTADEQTPSPLRKPADPWS